MYKGIWAWNSQESTKASKVLAIFFSLKMMAKSLSLNKSWETKTQLKKWPKCQDVKSKETEI